MFSARSSAAKVQPGLPPLKPPSKVASSSKLVTPAKRAGVSSAPAGAKKPLAASTYADWKEAFEAGVTAYKAGEFETALQAFDRALKLGGRRAIVLDSRAATLEKLGRIKDALLNAKALVELAPESHKGYVRGSHLSTLLAPPNYVRAHALLEHGLRLAPAHLRPALETRLAALAVSSHQQDSSARQRRLNWAERLPAELLVLVGEQSVRLNADAPLRLAGVCVRWREVVFSSPTLWSRLRLSQRKPKAKLTMFTDAANNRLAELFVPKSIGVFPAFIVPFCATLSTIDIRLPCTVRLADAVGTLRHAFSPALRHIHLTCASRESSMLGTAFSDISWDDLYCCIAADGPADPWAQVETLALTGVNLIHPVDVSAPAELPPLAQLRRLFMSNSRYIAAGLLDRRGFGIQDVLAQTPRLVELTITAGSFGHARRFIDDAAASPVASPVITLPELKSLTYSQSTFHSFEELEWDLPALERLDVSHPRLTTAQSSVYTNILFPPSAPDLLPGLTYLNLARTMLDEPLLIRNLSRLPALVELQVALCNATNALVEALTLAPAGQVTAADICPRLEVLGLAHSDAVTGGPILRLVASRLAPGAPPRAGSPAPEAPLLSGRAIIRSLDLDACLAVEAKALEWLRPRLVTLSSKGSVVPKSAGFVDSLRQRYA